MVVPDEFNGIRYIPLCLWNGQQQILYYPSNTTLFLFRNNVVSKQRGSCVRRIAKDLFLTDYILELCMDTDI